MTAANRTYLAVDLGASSGRVVAGSFDGSRLKLDEVHRFGNGPIQVADHYYWDVLALWTHVQRGLASAAEQFGDSVTSVGIDTWGVDFALLDRHDQLLANPYSYRDPRTRGLVDLACEQVGRDLIFDETGLQFMDINSLYQLWEMKRAGSVALESAKSLLLMPDLFNWMLTGVKVNEFTDATTTQFLNPRTRDWSRSLLERFELPTDILQSIAMPGTDLGPLRASVADATGLRNVSVVLPGSHDTASAVMAVPAIAQASDSPTWAYISSGTWSLMGVEVSEPVISAACREFNFTNEGGVGGTIRLLKNITGLWLVQECRRVWAAQGRDLNWEQLTAAAAAATPLQLFVNPDDPAFAAPVDMPAAIADFLRRTGQAAPPSDGAIIRCALESLALRCRMVFDWLEQLTGSRIETIHIVGGGTQNHQLCQMTANACQRPVVAGPVEATASGNVMMQAIARGDLASVQEARQVIAESFPVETYEPADGDAWQEAYARFRQMMQASESGSA